jgi:hypothetical protein
MLFVNGFCFPTTTEEKWDLSLPPKEEEEEEEEENFINIINTLENPCQRG